MQAHASLLEATGGFKEEVSQTYRTEKTQMKAAGEDREACQSPRGGRGESQQIAGGGPSQGTQLTLLQILQSPKQQAGIQEIAIFLGRKRSNISNLRWFHLPGPWIVSLDHVPFWIRFSPENTVGSGHAGTRDLQSRAVALGGW